VGKSRESVSNTLRLLELPEEIKKSLKKNEISEGHAKAILAVKKENQLKIFKEILEKKLSVREVEKRIETRMAKKRVIKEVLPQIGRKFIKISEIKNVKLKKIRDTIELTLIFKDKKDLDNFIKRIKFS